MNKINKINKIEKIEKIEKQSPDIRQDLISKLKQLYPPLFDDEGNLNERELKNLVSNFPPTTSGRYEFNWANKMSARRNAFTVSRATLKPAEDRSINFDTTQNLILEGDNLEVLKLLQKSYFNKVKCIYIDPPYNTGKDFIYSDNFTEGKKAYWEQNGVARRGVKLDSNAETQGRYHSNWLNMIYPRLLLARNLLKDDGVIFISIDDNEVHNLRKVMDEVFGEENFVAQITVQSNPRGRDYGGVAKTHDYLLIYAKSEDASINNLEQVDKEFPYEDKFGKFEIRELRNRNIAFHIENRPNLYYPFYLNPDKEDDNGFFEISLEPQEGLIEVYPKESQGYKTVWRWGKEKSRKNLNKEIVGKSIKNNSYQIIEKYRKTSKMARSIWYDKDVNTEKGTLEVKNLFKGKKVFPFSKPVEMLMRIIEMGTNGDEDEIALDFFAGSGTTAHAVMELNKEDGGNRKYILVQLPEATDEKSEAYKAGYNTIADICIERVKRVLEKIKKEDEGKLVKETEKLDLGFKVFRLASSFFPENLFTPPDHTKTKEEKIKAFDEYVAEEYRQLKLKFDDTELLYEVLLKNGFELNFKQEQLTEFDKNKIYKISDGVKTTLICLDNSLDCSTIEGLKKYKDEHFILLGRAIDTTKKWHLKRRFKQNLLEI